MLAHNQAGIDQVLLSGESQLLEPLCRLATSRHPAIHVVERRTPPHLERLRVRRRGTVDAAAVAEKPRPLRDSSSSKRATSRSDAATGQAVAAIHCLDHGSAEVLAQAPHADLHLLRPRTRRRVAPHRIGELVGCHRHAAPHRKRRDDRALLEGPGTAARRHGAVPAPESPPDDCRSDSNAQVKPMETTSIPAQTPDREP